VRSPVSWVWTAKASRLHGFLWLSHRGLLKAHCDFGSWVCSFALLTGVCQLIRCERFSDRAGVGWGSVRGVALTTRPHGRGSKQELGSPARWMAPLGLPSAWTAGCTTPLLRSIGIHLARATLASFPFTQPRCLAVRFPSQLQHLRCCCEVEHSLERWASPEATHSVAQPQYRCVWPKRWKRWHCRSVRGDVSTETRKPHSSVRERSFVAADRIKCGVKGQAWRLPNRIALSGAARLPGHWWPESPIPAGQHPQAFLCPVS